MAYTTINKSTDYFNSVLYTGNGAAGGDSTTISSLDFAPNLVWIKNRTTSGDATSSHALTDTVRGVTKTLSSNLNTAEATYSNALTNFSSNGFTVSDKAIVNGNGNSLVAWNWKAGTAVSGNTGGSGTYKTYTGSVNTTAGFSIIKYTGNGTAGHTIPHHLGAVPKMIITKRLDSTTDWMTYHSSLANTQKVALNSDGAVSTSGSVWNSTTPTSSVFAVGTSADTNNNNSDIIAYCFADVRGYSKFGSYTGNGNVDGTFVYTGFKPAFVMFKNIDTATNWEMENNKMPGYNVINKYLLPNLSNAVGTSDRMDFLSNGFKLRTTGSNVNSSGNNYIYMAFASAPLVGTNNIPNNAF